MKPVRLKRCHSHDPNPTAIKTPQRYSYTHFDLHRLTLLSPRKPRIPTRSQPSNYRNSPSRIPIYNKIGVLNHVFTPGCLSTSYYRESNAIVPRLLQVHPALPQHVRSLIGHAINRKNIEVGRRQGLLRALIRGRIGGRRSRHC